MTVAACSCVAVRSISQRAHPVRAIQREMLLPEATSASGCIVACNDALTERGPYLQRGDRNQWRGGQTKQVVTARLIEFHCLYSANHLYATRSTMGSHADASNKHQGARSSQLPVWELAGSLGAICRARSLLLLRTLLLCVIRLGRRARADSGVFGSGLVHCSVVREAQRQRRCSGHIRRCETGARECPRYVRQVINDNFPRHGLSPEPSLSRVNARTRV
jgi:hypothetical protein